MNYFKDCMSNGNGNIRTVLAFAVVLVTYGYYIPMLAIDNL